MFDRLTVRLFVILSLITLLVMSIFGVVRFNAASSLMEHTLEDRSHAVAERISSAVTPTIWNIYQKSYDRSYSVELASAILDAEMSSSFVEGIKVFGNFGHLFMGRIKVDGRIVSFDRSQHEALWAGNQNRIRYPISAGKMTIGNVEVSYSDRVFAENLQHNLIVEMAQIAIVAILFVSSLYLILKFALVSPMQSLQIAQQAMDSLDEAVFVTDSEGRLLDVNPAYSKITKFLESELLGNDPKIVRLEDNLKFTEILTDKLSGASGWSGEVVGRKKDGTVFPGWMSLNRVEQRGEITYVGVLTDIAEKREAEEKLHDLAFNDGLTKVPNRFSFLTRLEALLLNSSHEKLKVALLYIDLDNFKWINDSYGHEMGDKFLIAIADRFQRRLRATDVLYRIGGDEFTVIVSDYQEESDLLTLASDLVCIGSELISIDSHHLRSGASIGISTFPRDARIPRDLIRQADAAMFYAKESGRGQVRFFSKELAKEREAQQKIEMMLRVAIGNDELSLYYQPKARIENGRYRFDSAEALLRWTLDGKVLYPPDVFIAVAEKSNLICELGYWVIDEACRQLNQWCQNGLCDLTLAINLSPRQLRDEGLYKYLQQQLQRYDIEPAKLELEITEHAVIEDIESSIATLHKLKSLGVTIAMDDFGTGYSSLSYLKQLPIEVLKIDRSFIAPLPHDQDAIAIVMAIFSMADALNIEVVAEGVETLEQLQFLIEQRCHMIQGFYFTPPLPADQFRDWLSEFEDGI